MSIGKWKKKELVAGSGGALTCQFGPGLGRVRGNEVRVLKE